MSYTPEQHESIRKFQAAVELHCAEMGIIDENTFVGDWVMVGSAQNVNRPDRTIYWRCYANGNQPTHVTAGLLQYAAVHAERDIWNVGSIQDEDGD